MHPIAELQRFLRYLFGKRSEVEDLDLRDLVLTKTVLDIHRKRTHKTVVRLPLFALHRIHLLDRENAIQATQDRVDVLQAHKDELLPAKLLDREALARYLPSVSWIKVVQNGPDSYLAFEGNGRIEAMQRVFAPEDGMQVEVEQYHFRHPKTILRRLDRVRRMNGLL